MKAMFPRWIPKDSTEVRPDPPDVEAVVYCYTSGIFAGHPALVAYSGKRTKADCRQGFRNEAQRAEAIQEYFDGLREMARVKAEWKAERSKPTTLKVGDILSYSWGYDQTNVDFYEVLEVKGKRVVIVQEVGQKSAGGEGFMSGKVVPNGNRIGQPLRKVASGDSVPMEFGTASLWDGKPEYWSGYA
jgi:hypothetical protein